MILGKQITAIIRQTRILLSISLLLFASISTISAQKANADQFPYDQTAKEGTPPFKERLFFGGNFGLQFGTITDILISPVVGYWLLPRVAVAVGPSYRYYKEPGVATAIYGGKGYVQLVVVQDLNSFIPMGVHTGIFFHMEDELLSLNSEVWKQPLGIPYSTERFYLNTVLVGGGISQQLGRRASLNFMVLWPLNDSGYDIYSKPEMRISFSF
jgi:hypothetical protein